MKGKVEGNVLRAMTDGETDRRFTAEERKWAIVEADWAGEGYYTKGELAEMNDSDLAGAVLCTWSMYVSSQFGW